MLSTPPAVFAASTRSSAARCGSASPRRMRSISRSRTMSVRPSEAEHDAISGCDIDGVHVDVHARIDAQRARHDRALRMRFGLLAREATLADELADEAVVVGELTQGAVVHEVRARVADVADEQAPAAGDDDRGHRRAHPTQLRVVRGLLEHGVVGEGDGVVDRRVRSRRRRATPRSRSTTRSRPRRARPCRRRWRTTRAGRRRRARPRCCRAPAPHPRTPLPRASS